MAFNEIGFAGYTPPGLAYNVGKLGFESAFGGLFGGGGGGAPGVDINAELARINALYDRARTEGTATITQDFQAQRGELAQSQAARGILRSGVSQLGLARLGAARQQAIGAFNAQLSAAQAGQSSSLLNALLGRKSALDESAADRKRQGQSQLLGLGAGLLGSYLGGPIGGMVGSRVGGQLAGGGGGFNFAGSNMVSPPKTQSFYLNDSFGDYKSGQSYGGGGGSGLRTPYF